jgi:hypothetical protein
MKLVKKAAETVPPMDDKALNDEIMLNKKGTVGQLLVVMKAALKMKP